jgi:hypothetical protein
VQVRTVRKVETPAPMELEKFDTSGKNWRKIVKVVVERSVPKNEPQKIKLRDILLDPIIDERQELFDNSYRVTRMQMCVGVIWQRLMGQVDGIRDLGEGDKTGLDLRSDKRKFVMELKNRYNSDNSSAKKSNVRKLDTFKQSHSRYEVIYGVVNDRRPEGIDELRTLNGMEYRYLSGEKLLKFVFGAKYAKVAELTRKYLKEVL